MVTRQVVVRIIVTGDELLPPGSRPNGFRIVDSNSPMLSALIQRDGGMVLNPGIVPDDPQRIREALLDQADVMLVSGGSSVGQEDHAPQLVAELGALTFHGMAMRPSSPTGIGRIGSRWVFLLPGNPVSCLCAYDFFAGPAIRMLAGRRWEWPYPVFRATLARKIASAIGRVDYARVQLRETLVEPLAVSGASLLSSTTRADGFVVIPQDSEGYGEGAEVDVLLYDVDGGSM
jgi:molybdopterin molybdotransferase